MKSLKSVFAYGLSAVAALSLVSGCIFSPTTGGPPPPVTYKAPTSPYNVILNIQALYQNRDFQKYDETLSQDYVFRFIPDPVSGRQDSLIRAEEVNFAEHLFSTGSTDKTEPPASRISMAIDTVSSTPDARVGKEGWIRYIVSTHLRLTLSNANQTTVDSPAWFFFKQEPAGSGTWKLAEWQDQPTPGQPAAPGMGQLALNGTSKPKR